jgi:hypothetical protein
METEDHVLRRTATGPYPKTVESGLHSHNTPVKVQGWEEV